MIAGTNGLTCFPMHGGAIPPTSKLRPTTEKFLMEKPGRALRALTTLFSLLDKPTSPSYLTSHFQYLCSARSKNLRSSNNRLLRCPSHRTGFLKSSFPVQAVFLWNALPQNIRMATSRFTFKLKAREHLHKRLADSSHN